MRKGMILILSVVLAFAGFGCEDLTKDIDTNFYAEMQASITAPSEASLKSANSFSFTTSDTIDLNDIKDLKEYMDDIEDVSIESIKCTLAGIPDGESISEITIELEGTGLSKTLTNVTENSVPQLLDVADDLLDAAAEIVLANKVLVVKVSGISTSPMLLNILVDHAATVTVKIL